ncbi:MAG: hydroxyglutarate oxidase [Actinomycetia bacterium]|nr:hydroxyglutarate oxidase [Actinomycetes bacterium]
MWDIAVVGGGIVGLGVAHALTERFEGMNVVVLEKETALAAHQTGRNSGVIHSGVYYRPGSLKAELATRASRTMVEFCQEHGIDHAVCGKLIVATTPAELAALDGLAERGRANGIPVAVLGPEAVAEREPHLRCLGALDVPTTGIVDYRAVTEALASLSRGRGVEIRLGTTVERFDRRSDHWLVHTSGDPLEARFLVNCGGLQSDRITRLAGADPGARIIPFRGEYFDVVAPRSELVRGLIYPVPDPQFPFLGVHLTRGIHGEVHAGPNAVLALAREGYRWRDVAPRDVAEILRYPGFWRLARQHWRYGLSEVVRSVAKQRFVRSVQRLVPDLRAEDFVRAPAGVRAQAVDRGGQLVDDFLLVDDDHALHVTNAPSPAATASIEIGRLIAERVALRR